MADVVRYDQRRKLTDLSVVEFAILTALCRVGPHPAPFLLPTLGEWFGETLGLTDIEPAIRRLARVGYLAHTGDLLVPDVSAKDAVTTLYAMLYRILGYDLIRLISLKDPSLLDLLKPKGS
jgi:hypothetical protein